MLVCLPLISVIRAWLGLSTFERRIDLTPHGSESTTGGPSLNRTVLSVISCFIVGLLLVASSASGHEQSKFDRDDTQGPLDLAAARLKHGILFQSSPGYPGEKRFTRISMRLTTYEEWDVITLKGKKNFISLEFNLDEDRVIERCIVAGARDGELVARLKRNCDYQKDETLRVFSASRADKHSFHTAINKSALQRGLKSLEWRVITSYENPDVGSCQASTPSSGTLATCRDASAWRSHKF
jgi:hypothetical protein